MQAPLDFAKGEISSLGRIEVSARAVEDFAAAYDPQSQHLDGSAAWHTPLQGLAASGWQICALLMRQVKRKLHGAALHIEVPAIDDIRWLQPVRPGDVLEVRLCWRSKCVRSECRNSGGCTVTIEAVNQSRAVVLRMNCNALLACRGAFLDDAQRRVRDCAECLKRMSRVTRRPGGHLVRYFEDVALGDEIALGSYHFTAEAVRSYASIIDGASDPGDRCPVPLGKPRGAGVSGWHVVAAWMRRIVDYYHAEADWLAKHGRPVPLLGPAAGARSLSWCRPVCQGDRITFTSWAEHKLNIGTSSEWGLLVAGAEGINQYGEVVVSLYPQFLLQKRPA